MKQATTSEREGNKSFSFFFWAFVFWQPPAGERLLFLQIHTHAHTTHTHTMVAPSPPTFPPPADLRAELAAAAAALADHALLAPAKWAAEMLAGE